jgi:flagellar hook-associated protein 1
MPDFSALNTAYSGLRAAQVGIDTASHNVANAHTEGYTRQIVDLQTRYPFLSQYGPLGSGVEVARISRARDSFLDDRVRSAYDTQGALRERADLLGRLEGQMNEPDLGVSRALGQVWAAFEDVALNPADNAARSNALSELRNLTGRINGVRAGWDRLEADASDRVQLTVNDANLILRQLADLNTEIQNTTAFAGQPNDLLDQRDLLIDKLSQMVGASSQVQANGTVRVVLGGVGLVDGSSIQQMTVGAAPGYAVTAAGVAVPIGGEISGVHRFLTSDLPTYRTRLDTFSIDLVNAFNTQHALGTTAPGVPGGALLSYVAANPSGSITVAISNPALLAVSGAPYAPNSGTNAQALSNLRTSLAANTSTQTFDASIRGFITDLGALTQTETRAAQSQDELVAAAELTRKGTQGVSLDEEMVQMLQFQHSYSASARMMTTVDQMLETLIKGTGVVGR